VPDKNCRDCKHVLAHGDSKKYQNKDKGGHTCAWANLRRQKQQPPVITPVDQMRDKVEEWAPFAYALPAHTGRDISTRLINKRTRLKKQPIPPLPRHSTVQPQVEWYHIPPDFTWQRFWHFRIKDAEPKPQPPRSDKSNKSRSSKDDILKKRPQPKLKSYTIPPSLAKYFGPGRPDQTLTVTIGQGIKPRTRPKKWRQTEQKLGAPKILQPKKHNYLMVGPNGPVNLPATTWINQPKPPHSPLHEREEIDPDNIDVTGHFARLLPNRALKRGGLGDMLDDLYSPCNSVRSGSSTESLSPRGFQTRDDLIAYMARQDEGTALMLRTLNAKLLRSTRQKLAYKQPTNPTSGPGNTLKQPEAGTQEQDTSLDDLFIDIEDSMIAALNDEADFFEVEMDA